MEKTVPNGHVSRFFKQKGRFFEQFDYDNKKGIVQIIDNIQKNRFFYGKKTVLRIYFFEKIRYNKTTQDVSII